MAIFHTLAVESLRTLTEDAVEITFAVPDDLKDHYVFEHGQFVNLRHTIAGQMVERAYSICSAPYEHALRVAVKRVENGVFSSFATQNLSVGDTLEVSVPGGTFTCALDSSQKRHYLLIAAGSGITPILSILKMVLASETQSECTLVYANRTPENAMFLTEIEQLKGRYQDRFTLYPVYSQSDAGVYQGRLDFAVLQQLLGEGAHKQMQHVFLCGPEAMSVAVRQALLDDGMSTDEVHIELFTPGELAPVDEGDESAGAQVKLTVDGEEFEFVYEDSTRSLLDYALDIDGDLPFGCQNGSCGTCQARVVQGQVAMEINFALSDEEVDSGYVLMCQARPASAKVEISYDE